MTIVLSIDPGSSSGAIALVGPTGAPLVSKMPHTERDTWELVRDHAKVATFAVIEQVGPQPKQGISSTCKFCGNYYALRMALVACDIPWKAVAPTVWEKAMGCARKSKHETKTQHKNATKALAQRLWPAVKWTHQTADAALIGEYARRHLAAEFLVGDPLA